MATMKHDKIADIVPSASGSKPIYIAEDGMINMTVPEFREIIFKDKVYVGSAGSFGKVLIGNIEVLAGQGLVEEKGSTPTPPGGGGGSTPTLPNNTTFVSAEVPVSSGGNHIMVTISDDKGYASVAAEWMVKINGADAPDIGSSGHNTNKFNIHVGPNWTINPGDTVTVSHLIADSGIVKFTDQPVTNNFTAINPNPAPEPDEVVEAPAPKTRKKRKTKQKDA